MSLILSDEPKIERPHIPRNHAWERSFEGVSNKEYHEWPELSSSRLKKILQSPAHFVCDYHPERDAFDLGTAAHSLNLEQNPDAYVVMPEFHPIGKITKKSQVEDFEKKNEGKIILTDQQYTHLMGMHEVFVKNETAMGFLKHSKVEVSFKYLDVVSQMPCKFRPDMLNEPGGVIFDYKTTQSARKYEFEKAITRYGYHISAAHYLEGAWRVISEDVRGFVFIAQEKEPPYAIGIYEMSKRDIERSIKFRAQIMSSLSKCVDKNFYPDYSVAISKTELPGYAFEFEPTV